MSLGADDWAEMRSDAAPTAEAVDAAPALHWPTLPAFVAYLASWYRREVFDSHERVWCPEWWQHAEAVIRLEAMWRALEALRQEEATGVSVWLRDHLGPSMAELMHPHGPFRGCHAKDGHASDPLPPLPVVDPPEGWWAEPDSGL